MGPIRPARTTFGVLLAAATVAGTVTGGSSAVAAEYAPTAVRPAVKVAGPTALVIAHRGDRSSSPENTLAAFGSAIAKGADAIELDVRFSRTGFPVVMHDAGLSRTTDCVGLVSSKNVRQLHRCDAGSWFGGAFAGEQIPTLWDALKFIRKSSPTTKVILDMKMEPTRRQARKTMQRVRLNHMLDRTIVMSSTPAAMARMRQAGAKKRAFIFNSPAGWDHKYKIMVPYDTPITPARVGAANRRGAVVWAVQHHPLNATSLLGLANPVQGVLVNSMNESVLDKLGGGVRADVGALTAPVLH
jgi:glycerophosphoryl diester phosphodiesterase